MALRAVVDKIESDLAKLLIGFDNYMIIMPLRYLPKGVKENDILDIEISVNKEATEAQKPKVRSLVERLKNKNKQR